MTTTTDDTIVAVGTPPGRSVRGMVRVSGVTAFEVVREVLEGSGGAKESTLSRERLKGLGLPVWVGWFRGPRSYTGQDVVELQLPGNPALLDRVMGELIHAGVRQAEAGEFTFRAYCAGKLDLTQAEGVAATIAARSDNQLRAAGLLRAGRLGELSASVVEQLATLLALVEAGIDFTDQEDVRPISPGDLRERIGEASDQLVQLLARSRSWGSLEALPRVVLVGPPSAGKSTLFNALLGRTRAVIDPTPGTTRDVLAEPITLEADDGRSVEVMLVDLAGLDPDASGVIEASAQDHARQAIESADLVLQLQAIDQSGHAKGSHTATQAPTLRVLTKVDLASTPGHPSDHDLAVSALTGENIETLRRRITALLDDRTTSVTADQLALQPRHESALRDALAVLREAAASLADHAPDAALADAEIIAAHLRAALDRLGELGGEMTPDDVIGRVFATFCVGK